MFNKILPKGKISLGAIILIISIGLIGILITLALLGKTSSPSKTSSLEKTSSQTSTPQAPSESPSLEEETISEEIFSREGEIIEITEGKIKISTTEGDTITVKITPETKIFQTNFSIPEKIEEETSLASEEIELKDLKVGDKIIVLSETNVQDLKEFPAFRIDKIIE